MSEWFSPKQIRAQFDAAASTYDSVAVMQQQAADRLVERLQIIKLKMTSALDLGAGTGQVCQLLQAHYPQLELMALDSAPGMLHTLAQKLPKVRCLEASAEHIPLADNSVDLVISSMMLHWSLDIPAIFQEVNRVLRDGGLFLFTTLGPDSLKELRQSWAQVDDYNHAHHFYDMHDLGDAMLQAGLQDPVMDMQMLTLRYKALNDLFKDLKHLGARNRAEPRKRGLTTRTQWQKMLSAYEAQKSNNSYPVTYELLFGQAWSKPKQHQEANEVRIPLASLIR